MMSDSSSSTYRTIPSESCIQDFGLNRFASPGNCREVSQASTKTRRAVARRHLPARAAGSTARERSVSSDNVGHNLFEFAITILAHDAKGVLRADDKFRFDRFPQVRDAIRVRATQDADGAVRQRDAALLRDVIVADH